MCYSFVFAARCANNVIYTHRLYAINTLHRKAVTVMVVIVFVYFYSIMLNLTDKSCELKN